MRLSGKKERNMNKRILSLIMALCMLFTMCVVAQAEGHDTTVGHAADCTAIDDEENHLIACNDPACFVEATCEQAGRQSWHCEVCGHIVKTVETPAMGHNYVDYAEVPATCTTDGMTAYSVCENEILDYHGHVARICGAYKDGEGQVIPATGHTDPIPAIDNWEEYKNTLKCHDVVTDVHGVCATCGEVLIDNIYVEINHNALVDVEAKAPTCTEIGWEAYQVCSVCGVKEGYKELAKLDHDWQFVEGTAGKCEEDAWMDHYKCSMCGLRALKVNGEYVITPEEELYHPHPGHTWVTVKGYAATCTETGLSDGVVCAVCGEVKEAQEVIPALGHDWKTILGKAATCTEDGVVAHEECTRCGEIKGNINTVIPAHGHIDEDGTVPNAPTEVRKGDASLLKVTKEAKAPTCEEDGWTAEKVCPWCGEVREESKVIPATGHKWVIVKEGKMPGCETPGIADTWECETCGETKGGDPINPLGHALVKVDTKLPTCYEDGNFAFVYCTRENCDGTDNAKTVYAAFVEEDGDVEFDHDGIVLPEKTQELTEVVLKDVKEGKIPAAAVIPALNHGLAYGTDEFIVKVAPVAPTCEKTGLKDDGLYCELCDTVFQPATVLPALGHELVEVEAKDPTCTEKGNVAFRYCDREGCDYAEIVNEKGEIEKKFTVVKTEDNEWDGNIPAEAVVDALGHDVKEGVSKDATCEEDGFTAGKYCDRCGITLEESEVIPALGHDMVLIEEEAPDCTNDGYKVYECSHCGLRKVEKLNALGHEYTDAGYVAAVEPTCTEDGWTEGLRCARCLPDYAESDGWVKKPTRIPATGHTWTETLNVEPTCTEGGYENYRTCTTCGAVEGKKLEAKGHTFITFDDKAPTCTEAGVNGAATCTTCGYNRPQTVVPPLGHKRVTYRAGEAPTCTEPGYTEGEWCDRCHEIYVESVEAPALGHDWQHVDAKAATCETDGNKVGMICLNCGEKIGCEVIPATGHHGVWTVEIEPTYDDYGLEVETCTECGKKLDAHLIEKLTSGLKGDANCDGRVSLADVVAILSYMIQDAPANFSVENADMNNDGIITLTDALLLLNSL